MQKSLEIRLHKKYPGLWSLLNNKAQQKLPEGIIEYLNLPNYEEASWNSLQIPEKYINDLITICGIKNVTHTYRRDLSSVSDENTFLDHIFEIIACSSMAALTPGIVLHPKSGKGACDFSLPVEGVTVYGEVKRWPDNYWLKNISKPKSRLIFKPSADKNDTRIPRSMELYGKLIEATRQFSEGNFNVILLFTPSFGEELRQLQQTLFGDNNYFKEPEKVTLEDDGFFATEEGKVIATCYACRLDCYLEPNVRGIFLFPGSWRNPNAIISLPSSVENLFKRYDISNLKTKIEKASNDWLNSMQNKHHSSLNL
jgi:hypothetical protein